MVMDYLKKRIEQASKAQAAVLPHWVSNKNYSFKAWQYTESLKKEKLLYIKRHDKITDFSIQKNYQIKGSDIASALEISRASLMNTSKYSHDFRRYLDSTNQELDDAKEKRLKKSKESPSRGSIRNTKDELVKANTELRSKVDKLEALKTEEIVCRAFDQLPLPIRKKLGID